MSDIAIRAEKLGKRYRIGQWQRYVALRDVLTQAVKSPLRLFRGSSPKHSSNGNGHIWALKDASFEVREGEVVGIIGRNGAGKSTLLKILARVTKPTEGFAKIHGRMGSLLEVGTGFHTELTGRENVYLSGGILGMKKREIVRKFDEIVAFAEVEKFIDTPLKHYSSGMQMRLAFAVAAHLEPEILLIDEVLAVGDAAFQKRCLGKMGEVAKQGRTVLFVSHTMSTILNLCSRALLMEGGRLAREGPTLDIVKVYLASLEKSRDGDLSSFEDRQGRGRVRFARVWFEDDHGGTVQQAMSGETLIVVASYESKSESRLTNCRVSVGIEDIFGNPLFLCDTRMFSSEAQDLLPSGSMRCVIPRLPLSQGQYRISLFLEVNREVEDWLNSAITLQVVDGDFFGSGRQYPHGWQGRCVLVPHSWEVGDRQQTEMQHTPSMVRGQRS
jgi:lipopolysaccharide transport system ATP-binding protein